jgi:hypothetical protein
MRVSEHQPDAETKGGSRMKSSIALFVVVLAVSLTLTAVFASPLMAKTKYIWPGALEPEMENQEYRQRQASIFLKPGVDSGGFYAPVKLPVGAVVTRVDIFYQGSDGNAELAVSLSRVKMGEGLWSSLLDDMVRFNPTGYTGGEVTSLSSTNITTPKIQKNRLYYLYLDLRDDGAVFNGAKIYYNK